MPDQLTESITLAQAKQILDHLPVEILFIDPQGLVQHANQAGCRYLGKELEELQGLRGGDAFSCPHARNPDGCGGAVHCRECIIRNTVMETFANNIPIRRREAFQLVRDHDGERVEERRLLISTEVVAAHVLLTVEDITDTFNMQNAIASRQRSEALGLLTGGIAHRFNNLLTPSLGYINMLLLQDDIDAKTQKRYLTNARNSLDEISDLVQAMRGYTENGESEFSKRLPLGQMVRDIAPMVRSARKDHRPPTVVLIERETHPAIDPATVVHVMCHLLSNAYDAVLHTEIPRVEILISEEEGMSILTIRDNGCGIPATIQGRVFLPFFSAKGEFAEQEPLREARGTGLGLSMVQRALSAVGGDVVIDSIENRGTTVTIRIPATPRTPID